MWAAAGEDHPDGICVDAEGAVWYADVANRHCVRMREGGGVLATVELDRGAFACTLSRDDAPQSYVVGRTDLPRLATVPDRARELDDIVKLTGCDYRIIAQLIGDKMTVVTPGVGHRRWAAPVEEVNQKVESKPSFRTMRRRGEPATIR